MPRKIVKYDVNPEDFIALNTACDRLGISTSTARRRIAAGDWVEGKHWTNDASKLGKTRKILINIKEVLELRCISASMR